MHHSREIRHARPWLAAILAVGLVAGCQSQEASPLAPEITPAPSTALAPSAAPPTTGRSVVVFRSQTGIPAQGLALVTSLGGVVTSRHDGMGLLFASGLSATALQTLKANSLVQAVGPDYRMNWLPDDVVGSVVKVEGAATPHAHDPTAAARFKTWQWGPQRIGAPKAWARGWLGSPSVRVAILDTGVDFLHRELRGLVDQTRSISFVETEPTFDDLHFHGTHVASTVASNSVTVAGIAPHTTLIAVKVLSFEGSGSFEGVVAGIRHAADVDAHVINMSLGAEFDSKLPGGSALVESLRRAVAYAGYHGTLVVSAAGNSSHNLDGTGSFKTYPCAVSHLCVSATGPLNGQFDANGPILKKNHDRPATYTNYGMTQIDVAAPGGNTNPLDPDQTQGTWRDEDLIAGACAGRSTVVPQCAVNNDAVAFYVFAAGTSMATPHVSGVAALIQAQAGGTLKVSQMVARIQNFADDVGAAGPDVYTNHGRVNVYRSILQQ